MSGCHGWDCAPYWTVMADISTREGSVSCRAEARRVVSCVLEAMWESAWER